VLLCLGTTANKSCVILMLKNSRAKLKLIWWQWHSGISCRHDGMDRTMEDLTSPDLTDRQRKGPTRDV